MHVLLYHISTRTLKEDDIIAITVTSVTVDF